MKIQLLEPEGFSTEARRKLTKIGTVVEPDESNTADVQAVFTRLARVLDAPFHERYPALRWIVSPTTGLSHIDNRYFESRGVEVISLKGSTDFLKNIHATAEHTIALALALLRRIPAAFNAVRDGIWDRYPHKGAELHGKTVMILGYGRIGRLVAPLYQAFGCRVFAHDIVPDRVPPPLRCTLDTALREADILSIHVPFNDDTRGLVAEDLLSRLPSRAIVINTSRGEVLDQPYLFASLERGALAGAALDVLTGEPDPITADLKRRIHALGPRILITPHIGGFTSESLGAVELFAVDLFIEKVRAAHQI